MTLAVDRQHIAALVSAFGWDTNSRVCVYGVGFGWPLLALWENSIQNIQGIENSPYIHANLDINEDADIQAAVELVGLTTVSGRGQEIFNYYRDDGNPRGAMPTRIHDTDVTSNPEMNQLRSLMGGAGCTVLTYGQFALNRLSDAEAVDLSDNLGKLQPAQIIHFINPLWTQVEHPTIPDTFITLNAKTAEEWKVILPNDTFVELQDYRVVT